MPKAPPTLPETTRSLSPYFFGANGSHVLYGRSLIYRWALLLPLIEAYEQGLWPHSPGLLRRIVRLSLQFHQGIGSYDAESGKLRETYSAQGSTALREFYVDNGHPYWCMPAFSFLALPRTEIKRLIRQAYDLVFAKLPKKTRAALAK